MKKFCNLLLVVAALLATSCSNSLDEIQTDSERQSVTRSIDPRFTEPNITANQAADLISKFLNRTSFFYFEDVIGWDPNTYVYYGPLTVRYGSYTLKFRAIDCGISGKNGKYGVYADRPVTSVDVYSVNKEYPNIHGEIVYEINEAGLRAPVGVRYMYHTNCSDGNNNCWIVVEWESVSDFESIIGY